MEILTHAKQEIALYSFNVNYKSIKGELEWNG